jgi:hypothetical protein
MNATITAAVELEIEIGATAYAGEWIPLTLRVKRPDCWSAGIGFRNISCRDKSIQINDDFLDREMELRVGETCRLMIPILVPTRRVLSLDTIFLEIASKEDGVPRNELIPLPRKMLNVQPSLTKEIKVRLQSICEYAEGTKVALKVEHQGTTVFRNLTLNLSPEHAISSGKPVIRRDRFEHGDEESIDLVLKEKELDVNIGVDVENERSSATFTLKVEKPPPLGAIRYQFLEPCKPFAGRVEIHELDATNQLTQQLASDQHSGWPICGGMRYQIIIRSKQNNPVDCIKIRDIPGMIVVRSDEKSSKDGSWKFVIDVINYEWLRKSEIIYYDVTNKGEKEIGEIPILLSPQHWKHWKVAAILGATMTLQGVAAVPKRLYHADDPLHLIADFKLSEDYNLLFLLTIPAFWLGLKITDWLLYRLQD